MQSVNRRQFLTGLAASAAAVAAVAIVKPEVTGQDKAWLGIDMPKTAYGSRRWVPLQEIEDGKWRYWTRLLHSETNDMVLIEYPRLEAMVRKYDDAVVLVNSSSPDAITLDFGDAPLGKWARI